LAGLTQYDGQTSFFSSPPVSFATGIALLFGLGLGFDLLVGLISALDYRYGARSAQTSEHWSTGGRSMMPTIVASVVCSQWVWVSLESCSSRHSGWGNRPGPIRSMLFHVPPCPSTQSATLQVPVFGAYVGGVAAPFWYGAGATTQLALMGIVGYQVSQQTLSLILVTLRS